MSVRPCIGNSWRWIDITLGEKPACCQEDKAGQFDFRRLHGRRILYPCRKFLFQRSCLLARFPSGAQSAEQGPVRTARRARVGLQPFTSHALRPQPWSAKRRAKHLKALNMPREE